ncbi:MAG TPA: peptide chain release factor 3 [Buchnera sp. (in: enterobacteria)]|nr:peptide chain release factor 3 [Buchnera sp. (in: enterobacteria)]
MSKIIVNSNIHIEINKRRTCAIISHPDAGKTTITEKILFLGQAIHSIGTIKARGSGKYAKSDWMDIERKRGISVTSSIMQFKYKNCLINLLDTPGHEDFSEDTYRTLTAVDFCIMIIDAAKGVESRTRKLIDVTRLKKTPIITFINKLDRDGRHPIELLDQIEKELKIFCAPITWPINCGSLFQGIYHLYDKNIDLYQKYFYKHKKKLNNLRLLNALNGNLDIIFNKITEKEFREEINLIDHAYLQFDSSFFLKGDLTPVFFGSALNNFGIEHMLDSVINWAPCPIFRKSNIRNIYPIEKLFSGFIFKIQANMDSKHRDRIAFMRIVSGKYTKGIKLRHVRIKKDIILNDAFTFLAGDRFLVQHAYPGDIIGIHNHGTIRIGDTFTEGEKIKFLGIPNFSPEVFRIIRLSNPLKQKQLIKGLIQLSEEGAIQIFRPIINNDLILGAIGILQFDVVVERLKNEYKIEAIYEHVNIVTARWITSTNIKTLNKFKEKYSSNLALDSEKQLTYIAPSFVNLNLTSLRYPEIIFSEIREY